MFKENLKKQSTRSIEMLQYIRTLSRRGKYKTEKKEQQAKAK